MKQENIEKTGKVIQDLSNSIFLVERVERLPDGTYEDTGHIVQATISGKIRIKGIRILTGDIVKMNISPYDFTKGIITYRLNVFDPQMGPPLNKKDKNKKGKGKPGKK